MYLYYIEKYRVIALLFVVFGHVLSGIGVQADGRLEGVVFNLVSGGTFFFVFISGFLFFHINQDGFDYFRFIKKKLTYLAVPYLFLGAAPIFFYVLHADPWFGGSFLPEGEGTFDRYFWPSVKYVLTGRFMLAYWYIPFIIVMFLLSPLHLYFSRMDGGKQRLLLVFFVLVSLFAHRPEMLINTLHSVLYYMSVYLFGVYVAVHKDAVALKLKPYCRALMLGGFLVALIQADMGTLGSYYKGLFEYNGVDLQYVQKIMLCLGIFSYLYWQSSNVSTPIIKYLASVSFAIYFIHPFLLLWLGPFVARIGLSSSQLWLLFPVCSIVVFGMSIEIARFIKHVFGSRSRYLVGA